MRGRVDADPASPPAAVDSGGDQTPTAMAGGIEPGTGKSPHGDDGFKLYYGCSVLDADVRIRPPFHGSFQDLL